MKFKEEYWNPQKLLSYNKLFNFVIGNRGGGKSFGAKRLAINNWLRKREEFVYVRRYGTELDTISTYFDDIKSFYPEHEFEAGGGVFKIDNEVCGYYVQLSTSSKNKSTSYPNVSLIIYDEFIIDKGAYHYLKEEVQVFLDLYETIARPGTERLNGKDVRVLFISNAISSVNPYFIYFNIVPKNNTKFLNKEGICVELYKGAEFTERKRKTQFGKMIDNTRYGKYNLDNEFYRDNYNFVEKMKGHCIPWCSIIYFDEQYNIWFGAESGYLYFNEKKVPESYPKFCLTTLDHNVNIMLIKNIRSQKMFQNIRFAYDTGIVRFGSLKCKEMFYEIMNIL